MAAGLDPGRLELYLPAQATAVAQARAAVDRLKALDPHPDARFAVRLLVSELVTNAIEYGAARSDEARVRLAVQVGEERVRVEVGDRGLGFDASEVSMPGPEGESGRGLAFLDALATRWGVIRDGESCVWFELELG